MNRLKLLIAFLFVSSWVSAQDSTKFTLQQCIDYALENNLNVKRSRLNLQSSDINYDQSKMALLPSVNANGSYGYSWGRSIDPTSNQFVDNNRIATSNAGVNGNVTLFNGFRLQNTIKQNALAFESSEKNLKASENTVIFQVIDAYTNVLFTKELYENAKKQLSSTTQQTERTQKLVDAGALPQSNLMDFLAQQATNEVNVINAENNYNFAKVQLKQVMQLPPSAQTNIAVPELEIEIQPILDQSAYEIYLIALNEMPEIEAAKLNAESAELGISVAKGNLYPSLSLSGGLSTRYSDAADRARFVPDGGDPIIGVEQIGFVEGTNTPVLGPDITLSGTNYDGYDFSDQYSDNLNKFVSLNLNIPIFNGLSTRANVQRSIIASEQAKINSQDTNTQLWQAVEQAYYDVQAAAKSYNASITQVEAREESFRVLKLRYDNGAANFTEYQVSENDLFQAQSDLLRAKYDYIYRIKVLDFYQGKPLEF